MLTATTEQTIRDGQSLWKTRAKLTGRFRQAKNEIYILNSEQSEET